MFYEEDGIQNPKNDDKSSEKLAIKD
jgi:hypothetical protein